VDSLLERNKASPEQPRERLLARGAAALSDAELVALLLRTGRAAAPRWRSRTRSSRASAGLPRCSQPSRATVAAVHGVGPAKCAGLASVAELARRSMSEEARSRDALGLAAGGPRLPAPAPRRATVRSVRRLFLDSQNRLLAADELFRGTLAQTSVYPREVVKAALARKRRGDDLRAQPSVRRREPSRADELLTQALKQALSLVDIRTLDHFVIAGGRVTSFAERGML
jgi:DNA repair protein RadC